jgi:hypothetical protein
MSLGKPIETGQNVLTPEQIEDFCNEFLPNALSHCMEIVTHTMTSRDASRILSVSKQISELSGRSPVEIIHKLMEYS